MSNDGRLYVCSEQAQTAYLPFTVDSHLDFNLLEVFQDEELVDTFVVGERTPYLAGPLILRQGMNVFRFHAPGGCSETLDDSRCWSDALLGAPEEAMPPCDADTTCRSFVLDTVSLVAQVDLSRGQGTSVSFGNQMRLRGWTVETPTVHPGDPLTVTLSWEALEEVTKRHVVFAHLLSPAGELVAQRDDAPVGSAVPRSRWPTGATFRYPVSLNVGEKVPPGEYRLVVGVYNYPEVERLRVHPAGPEIDNDTVELGRVEVAP